MANKDGLTFRQHGGKIISSITRFFKVRLFQGGRNRGFFVIAAAAGILFFGAVIAGSAGSSEPGSPEDPLVTRSYVEAQIKTFAEKYTQWQVVDLSPGQRLEGKAGAELILRVGQAVVVDPVGSGVPDVTGGSNITAGKVVALNHHLIIPRTDGRGISARTKAVVMYRGDVQVK